MDFSPRLKAEKVLRRVATPEAQVVVGGSQASLTRRNRKPHPSPWAEAHGYCHFIATRWAEHFRKALGFVLLFLLLVLGPTLWAQPASSEARSSRFCSVDIFVDSKATPLAAYQLEFAVTNNAAKIVGIEGGEHPAFHEPPFYDSKAMQQERVILAAFSTHSPDQLPTGKTRVGRIHLQTSGTNALQCVIKLQTAGDAKGARIPAQTSFLERKPR